MFGSLPVMHSLTSKTVMRSNKSAGISPGWGDSSAGTSLSSCGYSELGGQSPTCGSYLRIDWRRLSMGLSRHRDPSDRHDHRPEIHPAANAGRLLKGATRIGWQAWRAEW